MIPGIGVRLRNRSILGAAMLASACAGPLTPSEETNRQIAQARVAVDHANPEPGEAPIDLTPPPTVPRGRVTAFRERGTGAYAAGTRAATRPDFGPEGGKADITLNYFNADVREVVRNVLGETLHFPYAIGSAVQGTITLQTPGPVRADEALVALGNALHSSNLAMVESGGVYRVIPAADAAQEAPMARPGLGTNGARVINLQFVSATEVVKVLQPLGGGRPGCCQQDRGLRRRLPEGSLLRAAAAAERPGIGSRGGGDVIAGKPGWSDQRADPRRPDRAAERAPGDGG